MKEHTFDTLPKTIRFTDPLLTPPGLDTLMLYVPVLFTNTWGIVRFKRSCEIIWLVELMIGMGSLASVWFVNFQCMSFSLTFGSAFLMKNSTTADEFTTVVMENVALSTKGGAALGNKIWLHQTKMTASV